MRIVFFGTPDVAATILETLVPGHEVALVVTRPDRPAGRSARPVSPPVLNLARALDLPVVQPSKVRTPQFREQVAATRPDALVVVAYGRILPGSVLDAARLGAINVHFSLLPAYRGAAPVQWALARSEERSGVTTMRMNEALDEGDILLQQGVPIEPDEHAPALQMRLARLGAPLLAETLAQLAKGELAGRAQDATRASYAPPLSAQDGAGDLTLSAREIEGRVRGFDPWPGFWVRKNGKRLRITRARAHPEQAHAEPGTVLAFEGESYLVACGGGSLLGVLAVQPEGRRALAARDACNGRVLLPGDRLEAGAEA